MASKLSGAGLVLTLLLPAVALAGESDGGRTAPRDIQVAARIQQIMEQMDAEFVALSQAQVWRAPTEQSKQIATLESGEKVLVTGRITVQNWYRVFIKGPGVGYIRGEFIEAADSQQPAVETAVTEAGGPEAAAAAEIQTAVVTPVKPAVEPEAEPAVARFDPLTSGFRDCGHCPEMIPVPAGTFTMGSDAGDVTERPLREVKIARRFALGRYEVTVAQWQACVAAGGCIFQADDVPTPDRTAMRNITWDDAQEYIAWLAKTTGKPYRLPSEAEWEYAARAGTTSEYWWGDVADYSKTNCKDCGGDWDRKVAGDIGRFQPNPFGLYDVSGGVSEWTADCWIKDYKKAPADGSARDKEDCQQRVLRGGSWRNEAGYLRSASRLYYDAYVNYTVHGLRVALTLE